MEEQRLAGSGASAAQGVNHRGALEDCARREFAVDTPGGPKEHGRHEPSGPLDEAERAEYERLRRTSAVRHRRLRICGASLLLVLAVLLAPVTVVATWVNSEITDADRYEQTVAPLARDPAVQDLVVNRVTDGVVDKIDVHKITQTLSDALADRGAPGFLVDAARSLDAQLKTGLTTGVHFVVEKVVKSDAFAKAWDNINRGAHDAAVNALNGEGSIRIQGDAITLNVGSVIEEVQKQLIGVTLVGADDIPGADKSIVLVQHDDLSEARDAARWLGVVGPWLPVALVVIAGLGIWAAPSRRVALMAVGIGIGGSMCALLIGLGVMRQIYLDAVTPVAGSSDAAAAVYDTLVRFLRQTAVTVLLAALLTVIAGYLYGRGRGAVAVRSAAARGTEAAGHGLARTGVKTGVAGRWLRTHRPLTTGVVLGAGVLTLFLWNYPTPGAVALVLLLVVVVLAVLGVLAAADRAQPRW
ncbi:hypothetical protein ABZ348_12855 [Streptomyces sp. NPDC005963]|uniref:hypothetical protein n=1 Tax=Streptomyces sp. NPDC005963 TaxID=3156721 RepID=UPI0033E9AC88